MTRLLRLAPVLLLASHSVFAASQYSVTGMVLKLDRSRNTFTASIQAIPGYMPAMTMPFEVRQPTELDGLVPGTIVEFVLIIENKASHVERIRILRYQGIEQDPLTANRLKLLNQVTAGVPAKKAIAIGELVPDFKLIDQTGRPVVLSELRGKAIAINFIYTSCALPDFCLRIANNFGVLRKRFQGRLGRDLILLTVTFDPIHDTREVLEKYARQWSADPATWHFLTGKVPDIARLCELFGVDAFPAEGLMDHSLHTGLIDRQGKLVANIEGNRFTAAQLGDLTESMLNTSSGR